MRSGSFYDELAELNQNLYGNYKKFKDYNFVEEYSDNTGIFICLYQNNQEYIFAIRGTDIPTKDLNSDRALGEGKIPNQYYSADKYYKSISKDYPNIIFTGYSLGGSVVQMLGSNYGNETICYEPFGTANILKGNYSKNIINFGNLFDWVFVVNFINQVGENYIMNVRAKEDTNPSIVWHMYGLYGKPSTAKKYNGQPIKSCKYPDTSKGTDAYKNVRQKVNNTTEKILNKSKKLKNQWYNKTQ